MPCGSLWLRFGIFELQISQKIIEIISINVICYILFHEKNYFCYTSFLPNLTLDSILDLDLILYLFLSISKGIEKRIIREKILAIN